jgi:hypothetical protein
VVTDPHACRLVSHGWLGGRCGQGGTHKSCCGHLGSAWRSPLSCHAWRSCWCPRSRSSTRHRTACRHSESLLRCSATRSHCTRRKSKTVRAMSVLRLQGLGLGKAGGRRTWAQRSGELSSNLGTDAAPIARSNSISLKQPSQPRLLCAWRCSSNMSSPSHGSSTSISWSQLSASLSITCVQSPPHSVSALPTPPPCPTPFFLSLRAETVRSTHVVHLPPRPPARPPISPHTNAHTHTDQVHWEEPAAGW